MATERANVWIQRCNPGQNQGTINHVGVIERTIHTTWLIGSPPAFVSWGPLQRTRLQWIDYCGKKYAVRPRSRSFEGEPDVRDVPYVLVLRGDERAHTDAGKVVR